MTDRIKDLFDAYAAGRVSRRDLIQGAARLGITAASANFLLGSSVTESMAASYDWQAQKGTAIKLLLD
ncbi:MAG TPA: ABC transporter substrate-binding protein, partial [Bradyrhizobium sp.]